MIALNLRRIGVSLAVAVLLVTMVVRVQAHSELVSASPGPGELLDTLPIEITLTFNESIASGTIDLFGSEFQRINNVNIIPSPEENQLTASLPELPQGVYTVQWGVASPDGHTVSGSYEFEVAETAEGGWVTYLFMGVILAGFGALWLQRRRIIKREDRAYGL